MKVLWIFLLCNFLFLSSCSCFLSSFGSSWSGFKLSEANKSQAQSLDVLISLDGRILNLHESLGVQHLHFSLDLWFEPPPTKETRSEELKCCSTLYLKSSQFLNGMRSPAQRYQSKAWPSRYSIIDLSRFESEIEFRRKRASAPHENWGICLSKISKNGSLELEKRLVPAVLAW